MFGGGGGGLDPRKMQQMMEQMGIEITEIDAQEVVIRTPDEELVFSDADVQRMDAQGQQTYQIVGSPETRARAAEDTADETDAAAPKSEIPESDVAIVAERTGTGEAAAREALEATDGDLAAAVERLE